MMMIFAGALHAGDMTSGGGDTRALEFSAIGYQLADFLAELEAKNRGIPSVLSSEVRNAVKSTRVVSLRDLMLDGQPVDAINTPDLKLIRIDRGRWDDLNGRNHLKVAFVLHEYLGVMRILDERYQVSHEILERLAEGGLASSETIECRSFVSRPFGRDGQIDDRVVLRVSQRGAFNAYVEFKVRDEAVLLDEAFIAERYAREIPPVIRERLVTPEETGATWDLELRLTIAKRPQSFTNSMTLRLVSEDGIPRYANYDLFCQILE
jgi:hypothetical protein